LRITRMSAARWQSFATARAKRPSLGATDTHVQGLALDLAHTGRSWVSEHGARGGDELNGGAGAGTTAVPVVTHSASYSVRRSLAAQSAPGLVDPRGSGPPRFAPSGLADRRGDGIQAGVAICSPVGWSSARWCAGSACRPDGTVASRRPFQSGRGSGMCARGRWLSSTCFTRSAR